MKVSFKLNVILLALSSFSLFATEDVTNIKPLQVATDVNSVDLLSGKYYPNLPVLAIPAAPRLSIETVQQFASKIVVDLLNTTGEAGIGQHTSNMSLTFGGKTSEFFKCVMDTTGCIAQDNTGSKLRAVFNDQNSRFRYHQASSGIQVIFDKLSHFKDYRRDPFATKQFQGTWFASSIIYPDGETLTLEYDTTANGLKTEYRPKQVTSNLGYRLSLTYHPGTLETGWADVKDATLTKTDTGTELAKYSYTLSSFSDVLGRSWSFSGFSNSLRGPEDYSNSFSLTLPGDSVPAVNVVSESKLYGSIQHSNFVTKVTKDGMTYNYSYDAESGTGYDPHKQFKKVTITGPENYKREVELAVFPAPQQRQLIKSDTDSEGKTTSYTYTGDKNVESVTFPEGNKEIYTYDSAGNVTSKTQKAKPGSGLPDSVTKAHYEVTNCFDGDTALNMNCYRPQYTEDAEGKRTDYTFDSKHGGLLTKLEPADKNGKRRLTTNTYKKFGDFDRLATTTVCVEGECGGVADQITVYTYWNNTALPKTIKKQNGNNTLSELTTFTYDDAGRLLIEDGPLSGLADAKIYRYDSIGRRTWEIGAVNQKGKRLATFTTYRNRDDQAETVEQGWIEKGSDADWTDPNYVPQLQVSLITSHDYNDTGLLQGTGVTSIVKTAVGSGSNISMTSTTKAETFTQFSYDGRNRQSCVAVRMNPASFTSAPEDACILGTTGDYGQDRITKHTYDKNSRLLSTTSGYNTVDAGLDIAMTYTDNGQVKTRSDGNGNVTTYEYDGLDRLDKTIFPDATFEQNSYYKNHLLHKLRKRDGVVLTHAYDNTNRLISTTVPSEATIEFDYDGFGRQLSVTRGTQTVATTYDGLGRLKTSSTNGNTLTYGYDGAGRRTSLTYADDVVVNYDVGADGQVHAIRINNSASALVRYDYDEFSRLRSMVRLNGVKTTLDFTGTGKLLNFNHDNINNANYEYNPAGQMVNRVTSSADFQIKIPQPGKQEYATNALNQYESINDVALSYDTNGNLTAFDGWTYGYNAHNRLISAAKTGTSLALDYDATGRLNSSTLNGTKTTFLYDGNELIAEYNAAGTMLKRYVHGIGSDDPLVSYDGSGTTSPTYLLADERGSIMAETNASGAVVQKHQYGPYGEPINQSASRFRYTGQILLPGTELYHYKARVYNPKLGRFLQTDPIGYKDGMNWYAYVGNDPMNAVDPDGTCGLFKGKLMGRGCTYVVSEGGYAKPYLKQSLTSPVGNAKITSGLGARNPSKGSKNHRGTDYGVPEGTAVSATVDGTVVAAKEDQGYGNMVVIQHASISGKKVFTLYAHAKKLDVAKGDSVKVGDTIMKSGNTGDYTTGPHLHYEILKTESSPVDGLFKKSEARYSPEQLDGLINDVY